MKHQLIIYVCIILIGLWLHIEFKDSSTRKMRIGTGILAMISASMITMIFCELGVANRKLVEQTHKSNDDSEPAHAKGTIK